MFFKCMECGHIFEDGEEARWMEDYGEFWGVPVRKEETGCPLCKGTYNECVQCEICGAKHLEDELNGGVCDDCLEAFKTDFDVCYDISFGDEEEIKINALLASLFEASDIEQILIQYIKHHCKEVDCGEYIDRDRQWFAEKLLESGKGVQG